MLNKFGPEIKDINEIQQKYVVFLELTDELYGADDMPEMVAAVCGRSYVDAEWEETKWHMRQKTATNVGLYIITAMEASMGFPDDDEFEPIIMYDERTGKIPYNYTDPVVDYDIHGKPQLIRLECDETFLYSLIRMGIICCYARGDDGKFADFRDLYDINKMLDEAIEPFRHITDQRVPLHKKLGE